MWQWYRLSYTRILITIILICAISRQSSKNRDVELLIHQLWNTDDNEETADDHTNSLTSAVAVRTVLNEENIVRTLQDQVLNNRPQFHSAHSSSASSKEDIKENEEALMMPWFSWCGTAMRKISKCLTRKNKWARKQKFH